MQWKRASRAFALLALGVTLLLAWHAVQAQTEPVGRLPRFTEAREAAALHFVKKHLPEMLSVLDQLKKSNQQQYEREIRFIFEITEILADLEDNAPRHNLELRIWIAENKAQLLLAKLGASDDDKRKGIHLQLQDLANQLVDLDANYLEVKAEQLERELGQLRDQINRIREQRDQFVKERYHELLQRIPKQKR